MGWALCTRVTALDSASLGAPKFPAPKVSSTNRKLRRDAFASGTAPSRPVKTRHARDDIDDLSHWRRRWPSDALARWQQPHGTPILRLSGQAKRRSSPTADSLSPERPLSASSNSRHNDCNGRKMAAIRPSARERSTAKSKRSGDRQSGRLPTRSGRCKSRWWTRRPSVRSLHCRPSWRLARRDASDGGSDGFRRSGDCQAAVLFSAVAHGRRPRDRVCWFRQRALFRTLSRGAATEAGRPYKCGPVFLASECWLLAWHQVPGLD
jgi:hypothetical protein